MKRLFLFLLACMSSMSLLHAETLQWARNIGGSSGEGSRAMAVDLNGNVYLTGNFGATTDFDPGPGVYNMTAVGAWDIYITKLDAAGNFLWAIQIGGNSFDDVYSIALDDSGNVYTTGGFQGTVDFDPGPGIYNLITGGSSDIFVSKLTTNGNFVWAINMRGQFNCEGHSMAVDKNGNVYTTGFFSSTVDFDPGPGTYYLASAGGQPDIFISKLDRSGNFAWAKKIGDTNSDRGFSLALDERDNVYTSGSFAGNVDFDPGPGTFNLFGNGFTIYISKLDASGNFAWAGCMGGTGNYSKGNSVQIDEFQNVYVTGSFRDTIDFDPGPGVYNLTAIGNDDIFIAKLDSSDNFMWARQLGGTEEDAGVSLAISSHPLSGGIIAAGYFTGTGDFDPGTAVFNLTAAGPEDGFMTKLDFSGNFIWAGQFGSSYANYERCQAVASDPYGAIYASGYFYDTADFDPDSGFYMLTSNGATDIFVMKMCNADPISISPVSCNEYTSPSGSYTWTASGVYYDTTDCNQVITVNLTIHSLDTSVVQNDYTLTSNAIDASYQWLYCDSSFAPIPGETDSVFVAIANGSYAVALSRDGCTDTTECYSITGIGIAELDVPNRIKIFPNPVSDGTMRVSSSAIMDELKIMDVLGRVVYQAEPKEKVISIGLHAAGIYFVQVRSGKHLLLKKAVVVGR